MNVSANVDGTTLTNSASLTYWPGTSTTDTTISGGTRTITVVEPRIATTKLVSPTSGVDAGDIVTYSIQFTNTGNSTAYDVTAEDILAQGVTYNNDASCSFFNGSTLVPISVSVTVGAGTLTFDGNPAGSWDIPATNPDSYIACTYTVTAQSSLHLDGAHTNTVDADWSSLNGTDANERLYNDTGTSPFDGTQDTASAVFNSPAPTFDKSDNATNLPIGATYTVTLTLTSPLGTLRNLTISDTLPAGLFYVTGTQSVSSGISPAPTFSVSGPNDGSAPATLTWTFGDAVVSSSPVTITYQVTVANVAGNQNGVTRTNSATLSYRDAQNTLKTLTDTDTITIVEPELDITKTVDDATPAYGQTLTYTLTVSHLPTSTATAYDILVTDTIPFGLTYVPGSISAPAGWVADDSAAPTLSWTCSAPCSLPVGSTATLSYQVTVTTTSPPNPGNAITNDALLNWTSTKGVNSNERNGSGGINDYRETTAQAVILYSPDLTVTKTDGQNTYIPGTSFSYTIVVSNVGNGDAVNATLSDPIPPQITSWSWTCTPGSGASCNGSGGYISTAFSDTVTIPAGSSITYTVVVQTDPAATTDLTNTVSVNLPAGMPDPTPANNTASDTDTPDRRADLSITKDDSVAQYVPGGTLIYTIIVSNAGPSNAPNALVGDNIPAHFTSWTWACSGSTGGASGCDPYAGNGNFSDTVNLPVGSSITYTVVANIASSATGDLTNIATVQPPSGVTDPTPENNTATDTDTQSSQAAVSVSKDDGVTDYIPGATLTYTIVVTNTGPSDALGVSVSDPIPPQFSSWSWTCVGSSGGASGCTGYSGSGDFSDSIDLAGPFPSSVTYQVVAQVRSSATGDLTNTVAISHLADITPGDNTASDTDTPNYQADLYVTKNDGSVSYTPGVNVTYTVTIGNGGPSDVNGAVLSDNLPAQATSWTWACSGSTGGASGCDPYSGSGSFSDTVDLPAGSSITYTVVVVIPSSATGDLVNTASIAPPTGVSDPDSSNNTASDTDTQSSQADLRVSKDNGVTEYVPGTSLTYTVVVTNLGPSDALGAVVSDTLPAQFTAWEWSCVTSSGATCNGSGGQINTDFRETVNLPAGSVITYTVTAQIASSATGTLVNSVTVDPPSGSTDPNPEDNRDEDRDEPNLRADLSINKDDGLTVIAPGSTITYTVTVRNSGPSDAVRAQISDPKPPQIRVWSWSCSPSAGATCTSQPNLNSDFRDTVNIPAGGVITYTVVATVDPNATAGTLVNRATVTPPEGVTDPDPGNNEDDDQDPIITQPEGDLVKTILASNQDFTPLPNVAIGEVITYEVRLRLPAASVMADLVLTDVLDRGLAFMGCDAVIASTSFITTTLPGGFEAACNDPINPTVQTEPPGSTDPADPGRRVTFTLGEVRNQGAQDGFLSLRYRAVVLNSAENRSDLVLRNRAEVRWAGGSLVTQAPEVVVVEPDFILEKKADRTTALPGSVINFTITLRHSPRSRVDAFNVVLRDTLPPGLTYIPGSLIILDGPPGGVIDDSAAPKLKVSWGYFPLLTNGRATQAVVRFQARLGQLEAGQKVTNVARLEWSTLPGDVSSPQSPYNPVSTERNYSPPSEVDILVEGLEIEVPFLPQTGFPAGRITPIPVQPKDKTYASLGDLWLEIPKLGVQAKVMGIPAKDQGWDLTWLWDQVGWLEGTAFPTHRGNSALTAHVYLPSGLPGPFLRLGELRYGDQITVHLGNQRYIYEVREVDRVLPKALSALRHEEYPWLTLITCSQYDERSKQYRYRIIVRAVLVRIEDT
ncbi:MAG: sortase [Anaerolineales bacterium]|nr:sortase [Anaerolineales bacterium]MDW8161181.1 sortase [Anaerolineales bacterium]